MSRNRVEPNFSDVEFLEDTTTYGYRYSVGEYAEDFGAKWEPFAKRPFGVIPLAFLVFCMALLYATYIAYDLLLISLPEQLPYQHVYKLVKNSLFGITLVQLGLLAFFYICGAVLMWEGSRAGWTVVLFCLVFSLSLCFQVMFSLFTHADRFGLTENKLVLYYAVYGAVALFHFLLFLYLFKGSVMSFYRVDGTGAAIRLLAAILVCVGVFFGENLIAKKPV